MGLSLSVGTARERFRRSWSILAACRTRYNKERPTEVGLEQGKWYNWGMTDFGKGLTLKEASPHLRNDQARIDRILIVTEADSVIEGLPPFSGDTRRQIRQRLTQLAEPSPGHAG
jgi:hypothetical protein